MKVVILVDLMTFSVAFITLLIFVEIPKIEKEESHKETMLQSAKSGLLYLKCNRGILYLILFLAVINLIASIYNVTLPAMILTKKGGGEMALGLIQSVSGMAMLFGSVVVSIMPAPKSRVRVIFNTLLISMETENFFLAFGKTLPIWCMGAILGWIVIPVMNTNMDVLLRNYIPVHMQGRVFAARNTLQYFTIPIGYFLGGLLVDNVFEPLMVNQSSTVLHVLFGVGKGSGTAFLFFIIGILGVLICLVFRVNKPIWELEKEEKV